MASNRSSVDKAMKKEYEVYRRTPGKFPGGTRQVEAIAFSKAGQSRPDVSRRTKKGK